MAKIVWVTNDCLDKGVELTQRSWDSHVLKRPFMAGREEEVKETVENPDVCVRESADVYHNYRLGIVGGKWKKLYLHVIVRRFRGRPSRVVSFWMCKVVNPGEIVCASPNMLS